MDRGAKVNPRQYQASALLKIEEYALANPTGKLLVVSPPGAGKTLVYRAEGFYLFGDRCRDPIMNARVLNLTA
jgi:hypothetical protein